MVRSEFSAQSQKRYLRRFAAVAVAAVVVALMGCAPSNSTAAKKPASATGAASASAAAAANAESGGAGGGTPAGGETSAGAESQYQAAMLAWSQCMRSNGVPNFPDPDSKGRFLIDRNTVDVNSAAFKQAQQACAARFPASPQTNSAQANADLQTQMLQYAKCMRSNGVSNFPDPKVVDGRVTMTLPPGIDPNGDLFRKAQTACSAKLPRGLGG